MKRITDKLRESCPNRDAHTEGPSGYLDWHSWANTMDQTHDVSRCPGCQLWLIYTPKGPDA